MNLDDVLSDKPVEKTTEAPPPSAEVPDGPRAEPDKGLAADGQPRTENRRREHQKREWEAQGRDPETGQFVAKPKEEPKKEEPKAEAKPAEAAPPAKTAAPAQEMTEKERAAFAAAADERRKRQALEQEIAQLRAKPAGSAEPKKTFWDDPDGALKAHQDTMAAERTTIRLQTTEALARSRYPDFDEKMKVFEQLVESVPGLGHQWLAQPDPAEFLYRVAKNHQEIERVGGMDAMLKKREEETAARVRAEMEAEYKKREEEAARQRAAIPGSLSDVRGATTHKSAPVWGGPTPLADVLSGK